MEYAGDREVDLQAIPLEAKLDAAVGYLLSTPYEQLEAGERNLRNHILAKNGAPNYRAGEELISTMEGVAYVANEYGEKDAAKFSAGIQAPLTQMLTVMERDVEELYQAATKDERQVLEKASFSELYTRVMDNHDSHLRELIDSSAPYSEIMAKAKEYDEEHTGSLSPAAETIHDFSVQVDRDRRGISRQAFLIPYGLVSMGTAAAAGDIAGGLHRMANIGVLSYGREGVRRGIEMGQKGIKYMEKLDGAIDKCILDPINERFDKDYHCEAFTKGYEKFLDGVDVVNEKMAQYTGFDLASTAVFGTEIALGIMSPYALIPLAALINVPRLGMYVYDKFKKKDDGSHLVDEVDKEQGMFSKFWNRFKRTLNLGFSVGDHYVNPLALKAGKKVTKDDLDNEIIDDILKELEGQYSPNVIKGVGDYLHNNLVLGEKEKERIRGVTDANLGCVVKSKVGERDLSTGRYNWVPEYAAKVATELKVPYEEAKGHRAETSRHDDGTVEDILVYKAGPEGKEEAEVVYRRTSNGFEGTIVPILDRHAGKGGLVEVPIFEEGSIARYDMFEYEVGLTDLTDKEGAKRILFHEAKHLAHDLSYWEGLRGLGEKVISERLKERQTPADAPDSRPEAAGTA